MVPLLEQGTLPLPISWSTPCSKSTKGFLLKPLLKWSLPSILVVDPMQTGATGAAKLLVLRLPSTQLSVPSCLPGTWEQIWMIMTSGD